MFTISSCRCILWASDLCLHSLPRNLLWDAAVKLLKFWTPEKLTVIILKFDSHEFTERIHPNNADGMINSVDPDQNAPLGAV